MAQKKYRKALCVDSDTVRVAVRQDGLALRWAHVSLRAVPDIVRLTVNENRRAIRFAFLRADPSLVRMGPVNHPRHLRGTIFFPRLLWNARAVRVGKGFARDATKTHQRRTGCEH